jgi:hypothetical protein
MNLSYNHIQTVLLKHQINQSLASHNKKGETHTFMAKDTNTVADATSMSFRPVDLDEIPRSFRREGSASYKLIQAFLATNEYAAAVEGNTAETKTAGNISAYARANELPVKAQVRGDMLVLIRLDRTKDGVEIENWKEINAPKPRAKGVRKTQAA